MSFLFGEKKKDPKEVMRESQKALKKTEREMERERNTMKRQEEAILKDIKKAAKVRTNDVSAPFIACHQAMCRLGGEGVLALRPNSPLAARCKPLGFLSRVLFPGWKHGDGQDARQATGASTGAAGAEPNRRPSHPPLSPAALTTISS